MSPFWSDFVLTVVIATAITLAGWMYSWKLQVR
jgi:hypothetical protein